MNKPQIVIERDYLSVRDKVFCDIYNELKNSLPQELSLDITYDSLQIPTVTVKKLLSKWLFFKKYQTLAIVDFSPNIFSQDKEPTLDILLMSTSEPWSVLENRPGTLLANCYNQDFEKILIPILQSTSQKLKLLPPVLKRNGYDIP